jgi:hypothetical protein
MHPTSEIKCTESVDDDEQAIVSMTHGPGKMRSIASSR